MATIRVNYAQARACAKKLSNASDECGQMIKRINTVVNGIPASWSGEAATAFSAELQNWRKENKAIEKELDQLAALIRKVADEFEEAERRIEAASNAAKIVSASTTKTSTEKTSSGSTTKSNNTKEPTLDLGELADNLVDLGKDLMDRFF